VSPPAQSQRVLVIKPSSLGDVVSAMPVLHGLRRTFPEAHLAWLVTPGCAGILAGQRGLDEIILFDRRRFGAIARSARASREFVRFCRDLRRRRFHLVLDLQGLFRSGFLAWVTGAAVRVGFAAARELADVFYTHRVVVTAEHTIDRNIELARAVGIDARPDDLVLSVLPEAREAVRAVLSAAGIQLGSYFLVVPGTRWPSKLYPVRHWRAVVTALAASAPVVVVGSPEEERLCAEVVAGFGQGVLNLAGRTTLAQFVALVAAAGCVVCCDSAANFIAPAVGTPFVTLMGPTRPERTGPYRPEGKAIRAELACIGCLRRRCRHATCMQLIRPGEVVAAAREALAVRARLAAEAGVDRPG